MAIGATLGKNTRFGIEIFAKYVDGATKPMQKTFQVTELQNQCRKHFKLLKILVEEWKK